MVSIDLHPPPVQRLPGFWLTTADVAETFVTAGELGFNVLTGLIQQAPAELAERIAIYRRARGSAALDPDEGRVTTMVHTFLDTGAASAMDRVRAPFTQYLRSFVSLWAGQHEQRQFATLTDAAKEEMLRFAVERFARQRAMFGTVEQGLLLCDELERSGVDEVACLIDFGLPRSMVLEGMARIVELNRALLARAAGFAAGTLRAL
jgi:natural product biosynthesis luciferase-like monooxygenase protein